MMYDEPLFRYFMAIRDLESFTDFCKRYGFSGFEQPLKSIARNDDSVQFLDAGQPSRPSIAATAAGVNRLPGEGLRGLQLL